jgi:hypothetical protein
MVKHGLARIEISNDDSENASRQLSILPSFNAVRMTFGVQF